MNDYARLITQCSIMIFIGIGGGTVWLQNWKYGGQVTQVIDSHSFLVDAQI